MRRHIDLLRVVSGETAAYVRSGILAGTGVRIHRNHTSVADLGVVFVHGLAARANQFAALQRALGVHTQWFDAYEYNGLSALAKIVGGLRHRVADATARCRRVVIIGHSLGGLVARMMLQREDSPHGVAGFVSICAPLHGTIVGKLGPTEGLRSLHPDSPLFEALAKDAHRLSAALEGRVLTIGARRDHFVSPHTSAFLEGAERLELHHAGHVGSLFHRDVHAAVSAFVGRIKAA